MKQPGRNQACPCRSGRKYKQCCGPLHQRARAAMNSPVTLEAHYSSLEDLSNQVPGLVDQRRFDEAEATARRLVEDFPAEPDGLERLAEVYAARGDKDRAARAFRQAAFFHRVLMPGNTELADWLAEQAERMDRGLDVDWPTGDLG